MCWTKCPRSHQPHSAPSSGKCSKWRKHDTWHNCLQLRPFAFPAIELPASSFLGHVQSSHTVLSSSNVESLSSLGVIMCIYEIIFIEVISFPLLLVSWLGAQSSVCTYTHTHTSTKRFMQFVSDVNPHFSPATCVLFMTKGEMRVDRQSLPASNTWSHDNWGFNGISIGVSYTSAGGERWISLIHIYFQFEVRWEFIKERQVLVDWPWSQFRAGGGATLIW